MDYSTRTTQHAPQAGSVARRIVPRPAGRGTAPAGPAPRGRPRSRPRSRPQVAARAGGAPGLRLTGLGCGVLASTGMAAAAWLCELFGGAPVLYGVLFVAVALAGAIWVRPADLVCAPIAAPIAFATGLVTTSGLMGAVTELALRAPWLFAGTAVAAGMAVLRKALLMLGRFLARRRQRQRAAVNRR